MLLQTVLLQAVLLQEVTLPLAARLARHTLFVCCLAAAWFSGHADAQWVAFLDQTDDRLSGEADLTTEDDQRRAGGPHRGLRHGQ